MKKKKSASGSTLSQKTRAARGYGNRTFSFRDETSELLDELVATWKRGDPKLTQSSALARAIELAAKLEGLLDT